MFTLGVYTKVPTLSEGCVLGGGVGGGVDGRALHRLLLGGQQAQRVTTQPVGGS